jgi:hypothetical protein
MFTTRMGVMVELKKYYVCNGRAKKYYFLYKMMRISFSNMLITCGVTLQAEISENIAQHPFRPSFQVIRYLTVGSLNGRPTRKLKAKLCRIKPPLE